MITESGDLPPPQNKPTANFTLTLGQIKAIICQDWPGFLSRYGLTQHQLSGKHSPCPLGCGGKRSFRFQNKCKYTSELRAMWVCTHCTGGALRDGYTLVAMLQFNGDISEAFKSIITEFKNNNPSMQKTRSQYKNTDQVTKQEDKKRRQEQELLSRKEIGTNYTEAILALCVKDQHGYFIDKGYINHKERITSRDYEISYERLNSTTGEMEKKIQKIPQGSAIIPLHEIESPKKKTSFQFIAPEPNQATGKYYKAMLVDAPSDGIHIIYGDSTLPYIGIVEGKATGKAVHAATGATVVVAFNANGISSKAQQVQDFFSGKRLVVFGDNDKSNTGQKAAYKAAALTNGFSVIPPNVGDDWDDHLQKYGDEATETEINRQLSEFQKTVIINEKVVGISINNSILLASGEGVLFDTALEHHIGTQCRCPLSGGHAIINAGSIYSFDANKTIVPVLIALHEEKLITECRDLKTMFRRVIWANHHNSQKHLYALVWILGSRFGADILATEDFDRLLEKDRGCSTSVGELILEHNKEKLVISNELYNFIGYLFKSKINQATKLWELNPKQFKHHRKINQQENGRIDWQPTVDEIITSHHTLIAVQAMHGQGKTEDLASKISNAIKPVVYTTLRAKLVAQGCTVLNFFHYQDDKKEVRIAGHVPEFACCTPSFKHKVNLDHIRRAKLIIIDEFSQWFSDLLTNKKCISHELPSELRSALKEAISNGCKIVLLDADLTTKGIQQFMRFLEVNINNVLLIIAESPKRELTISVSTSTAVAHYQTHSIELMKEDLEQCRPFLVAMESADGALSLYDKLRKSHPDSHIVLLTGDRCLIQKEGLQIIYKSEAYIENINNNLSYVDALIYTNVIGTGVSINHEDHRFRRCYGLFSGWVLSPMDAIQMLKRGRNVTEYTLGLFCRASDLHMTSFYKDLGTEAWQKLKGESDGIDIIAAEMEFSKKQNAALFIAALFGLLRDKHQFKMISQLSVEGKVEDLQSVAELREEHQKRLIGAKPHTCLKHALSLQMDEYNDDEERFSCEARICMDYYNISEVTEEAAELWFNPTRKAACDRLELIVKLLTFDHDLAVKNFATQRDILIASGITLQLITSQELTQNEIINLRNTIAAHCPQLVGLGFIPERYVKASKISIDKPIVPVQKILNHLGLNVITIRSPKKWELNINIPTPMISRLKLDIKPTKGEERKILKEKALALHADGNGYKAITKALNLKSRDQARRLLGK